MDKPISLTPGKDAIARARATLRRLGRGAELKQQDQARSTRRAWENVSRGKRYARLQREARQEARRALNQIWRAFLAYDKARDLTPSRSEYELRADIERTFKQMAGLP
jgi:hypothetical protein